VSDTQPAVEPTDVLAHLDLAPETTREDAPVVNAAHEAMAQLINERHQAGLADDQPTREDRPFAEQVNLSAAAGKMLGEVPGGGVQEHPGGNEAHLTGSIKLAEVWDEGTYSYELYEHVTRPIPEQRHPLVDVFRREATPQWASTPGAVAPSRRPTIERPPAERTAPEPVDVADLPGVRMVPLADVTDLAETDCGPACPCPDIPQSEAPPAERAAFLAVAAGLGREHVQRTTVDVPAPQAVPEVPEPSRWGAHRTWRGIRARRRRRPLARFRWFAS
jgi:hypothetical protein